MYTSPLLLLLLLLQAPAGCSLARAVESVDDPRYTPHDEHADNSTSDIRQGSPGETFNEFLD
uniref:Uncharacterized protein n=1 Tax=Oryza glumipatula TaxID=40148 RepID=A0A0E0AB82_9ORYZ